MRICAFDWYQNRWPWTAVRSDFLGILRQFACLGGNDG